LERDVRSYRLLQGVLRLTRTHPKERIDWACGVALERRAFRYQTLKRLLEEAALRAQQPQLRQRHELIRDLVEYRSVMTTTHQPLATRQTPAAVLAGEARNEPSTTSDTWETTP
jgi:hypothetical protein